MCEIDKLVPIVFFAVKSGLVVKLCDHILFLPDGQKEIGGWCFFLVSHTQMGHGIYQLVGIGS